MKSITTFALLVSLILAVGISYGEEAVAYVNGRTITEQALADRLKNSQIINTYAAADMTDDQKADMEHAAREAALDALIQEEALLSEAEARGLTLDHALVKERADLRYHQTIAAVEQYVLEVYPDLQGEELNAQVNSLLAMSGGTRETYRKLAQRGAVLELLDEALMQEFAQPDETAVQNYYQQLYHEQRMLFDQDQNSFEAAMLQGKIVLYRPTELKLIQKAEFLFEEEALGLIRQTAAVDPEMAQEMRDHQHSLLYPQIENACAALISGEKTFPQLMEELKEGSSRSVNYFHESSTRFNEDYHSRASAFSTIGEISTPYTMTTGYAILYYAGVLPACEQVPLEEVYDQIAAEIAQQDASDALKEAKRQIIAEAAVERVGSESK